MIQKTKNLALLFLVVLTGLTLAACNQSANKGKGGGELSVDEFEKQINAIPGVQLIDVRTPDEFAGGHLQGAVNADINGASFEEEVAKLDKSKAVYVYCLSGGRSSSAANNLREKGFTSVYTMPGIMAWNSAGKALVTNDGGASPAGGKGMSEDDYKKAVAGPNYVLVDFNAVWCGPCKKLSPIVDKIGSDKKDKLKVLKIDADENPDLLTAKGIEAIPYLELYKDGKLVWSFKGLLSEEELLKQTGL